MTEEGDLRESLKYKWVSPRDGRPIPEIYTNYIVTSWSMYDIRARIGQLVPSGEGRSDFVVEERAALTLTWQHAKVVASLLAKLVAEYERTNGEIPVLKLPQESGIDEAEQKKTT
jgi:hypothetical protein